MKTLYLTLHERWFNLIFFRLKTEEFREMKPFWIKRLSCNNFDRIVFSNGYNRNSPKLEIKCNGIENRRIDDKNFFVIKLDEIICFSNCEHLQSSLSLF